MKSDKNSKKYTHFMIVLDESGSMRSLLGGVKAQLKEIVAGMEAKSSPNHQITCGLVSVGKRDGIVYREIPVGSEISKVAEYIPIAHGYTPLMDGISLAASELQKLDKLVPTKTDVSYVVVVLTDGEENTSKYTDDARLSRQLANLVATDKFSFAFQVPKQYLGVFKDYKFTQYGSLLPWEQNLADLDRATKATVTATSSFLNARENGVRSTRTYYSTDAGGLTKSEVKNTLNQLDTKVVRPLEVTAEADIASFITSHGLTFVSGASYYLLSKKEKIQAYKEIILVNIKTPKVYYVGKDDARALLGLPVGKDEYIEPGNHGDWKIYIQSTSNNRKLVRGTKLLYRTDVAPGLVPQTWDWQAAHDEAVKKAVEVRDNANVDIDLRVFAAVFAGGKRLREIDNSIRQNVPKAYQDKIDNTLRRLKAAGFVEYTKDGWVPTKGANLPKVTKALSV